MQTVEQRGVAQFFFEIGYGACFAQAYILNGGKAPWPMSDAEVERAWEVAGEAHDDPEEFDRYLALAALESLPPSAPVDAPWLVWSHEHNAFWNPDRQGYTRFIERAGRYTKAEADLICQGANYRSGSTLDKDKLPPEICFPAPEALALPPSGIAEMVREMWQPIETAPYDDAVEVKVGGMTMLAKLLYRHSEDENGPCDQWVAVNEGEHPPCWSGGACWASNEDEVRSLQPTRWRTAQPADLSKTGGAGLKGNHLNVADFSQKRAVLVEKEISEGDAWQPIETATKDFTSQGDCWIDPCLVWVPDEFGGVAYVAQMDAGEWIIMCGEIRVFEGLLSNPTHWRPLPAPPADLSNKGVG